MSKLINSFIIIVLMQSSVFASVDVLFHPYDATLEKIATWVRDADNSIDIAMYNLDSSASSPIIQALSSESVQNKITSGELKVRMIFEGYKGKEKAIELSLEMEALGVDVRFLKSGRKVHHKFAVFDQLSNKARLVSGSANWSMSSRKNYNENILFIQQEYGIITQFQREFNLLWSASEEVGEELVGDNNLVILEPGLSESLNAVMNSDNFYFSGLSVRRKPYENGFHLTRALENAIDKAQGNIKIATTRIKLRPIYDALLRAAERGVSINIVVNMDQYAPYTDRKKWELATCQDPYDPKCSSSVNFSHFLDKEEYPGHENIQLRIKFFDLDPSAYLSKQMHSKYLIVDDASVYTGSFNWSYSGEYSHIENLIRLKSDEHQSAVVRFISDFSTLWDLNRDHYKPLKSRLVQALKTGVKTDCNFEAMSLSFYEIDVLQRMGWWYDKELEDACL